jgi:hypothetical protein
MEAFMKKKHKPKTKRVPIAVHMAAARAEGVALGVMQGKYEARQEFAPKHLYHADISNFIHMVESWPLEDNGVVMFAGTDLVHHVNGGMLVPGMRAVASELRRLGYGPVRH